MKKICPLVKDECLEHGCTFYTHLIGRHPQTGKSIDEFACAIPWVPILLIENSRATVGVQAAVESMRNEVVQRQDALNSAVALGQRQAAKQIGEEKEWTTERLPKAM